MIHTIYTQTSDKLTTLCSRHWVICHNEEHCHSVLATTKVWIDAMKQSYFNNAHLHTLKDFSTILRDIDNACGLLGKYQKLVDKKYGGGGENN